MTKRQKKTQRPVHSPVLNVEALENRWLPSGTPTLLQPPTLPSLPTTAPVLPTPSVTAPSGDSTVALDNNLGLNITAGLNSGINTGVALGDHRTGLGKTTLGAGNGSGSLIAAIALGLGSGSGSSGGLLNAAVAIGNGGVLSGNKGNLLTASLGLGSGGGSGSGANLLNAALAIGSANGSGSVNIAIGSGGGQGGSSGLLGDSSVTGGSNSGAGGISVGVGTGAGVAVTTDTSGNGGATSGSRHGSDNSVSSPANSGGPNSDSQSGNSSGSSSNGAESGLGAAPENLAFSLVADDSKAADAPNGPTKEDVPEVAPDAGAQAAESGLSEVTVDVSGFLPQASDLLANFLPFDPATAALDAQQIRARGEQLGKELIEWAKETQLSSWLMAAVVAATACEVARRRMHQSKVPQAVKGNAEGSTDAWFPDSTNL